MTESSTILPECLILNFANLQICLQIIIGLTKNVLNVIDLYHNKEIMVGFLRTPPSQTIWVIQI